MSAATGDRLRTLMFGDPSGGLWGAAIDAGPSGLVLGDAQGATIQIRLSGDDWAPEGRGWRLHGEGFELHAEPAGEDLAAAPEPDPGATMSGFQELCRVQGAVTLEGERREVDCVATRCCIDGLDGGALDSVRAVSGWFGDLEAFTLLALRRSRSSGHESDLVAATLFDPEGWVPVADPRLSTTYDGSGIPARATLELWIGEGETEYPRRAAGEAAGSGAAVTAERLQLRVVPLRCHSRGEEGAGVYVLFTGL